MDSVVAFVILLALGLCSWGEQSGFSESRSCPVVLAERTSARADTFPHTWVGDWRGDIVVYRGRDTLQTARMRLGIHPADSGRYTWHIGYGEASADERPYTLMPVDATRGHWQIDEHNGIVLDAHYHAGSLYSRFAVMGNLLLSRDELAGDTLFHEVVFGSQRDTTVTGDSIRVGSYPIGTVQRARLIRTSP